MDNRIIKGLIILFFLFNGIFLFAGNNAKTFPLMLLKSNEATNPQKTLLNINNWSYWLNNDGSSGVGTYPRGTASAIYKDGIVWGAKINNQVHVGGQTYRTGTQPVTDHIYRIRSDWAYLTTEDVKQDAAEFYKIPVSSVSDSLANILIDQYINDWRNWPVDQGAPFYDTDSNGVYNPVVDSTGIPDQNMGDYPGYADADQVIWYKVNDLDAAKTNNLYGTDPLGLQVDVTIWGYNQDDATIGQLIFKKYSFENISTDTFEDMYLAQWSDPDIGASSDDLVGCDSSISLGFAYNGNPTDADFDDFGIAPPSIGYCLLQGPVIPSPGDTAVYDNHKILDYKNLTMTSFSYFSAGNTEWDDPVLGKSEGALQWYNLLRGYIPTSDIVNPTPFTHRDTEQPTKFPLNGDVVSKTGDIDGFGQNFSPADRRLVMSSGPITFKPGNRQELVIAVVGGLSVDYLASVDKMKMTADFVDNLYGKGLKVIVSSIKHQPTDIPGTFHLAQNYPNPFNPNTVIQFDLQKSEHVKLEIFNLLGEKISTLVNSQMAAGTHKVNWNGAGNNGAILSSGIYFYRLTAGKNTLTKKMILAK